MAGAIVTTNEKTPSKVVPVLVAALICDVAVVDPGSGKKSLIGIFDRLNVVSFPTKQPMALYAKLADADGFYTTEIRFVQVATGKTLAKADGELTARDKLKAVDMYFPSPPLPILEAGRHEFQLWANSMFLGGTFLDAVQRPSPD